MSRSAWTHRKVLEHQVSVQMWTLTKTLNTPPPFKAYWENSLSLNGNLLADVKYTLNIKNRDKISTQNYIQFEYEYKGQHYKMQQPIEAQPVNLGGHRFYFRCMCTHNGKFCGKRVKALYFAGHIWACRHCLELRYIKSRYSRDTVKYLRCKEYAEKKAKQLKANQHPRLANRMIEKAMYYDRRHQDDINLAMLRFVGYRF